MNRKKIVAEFELILMISAIFAFSYGISLTEEMFPSVSAIESDVNNNGIEDFDENLSIDEWIDQLSGDSADITFAYDTGEVDAGCCEIIKDGTKCATTSASQCSGLFAQGVMCSATDFCKKGCCYNDDLGIYDTNVLESDCFASWDVDMNCNLPGAELGCCVIGTAGYFETEGECRTRTIAFGEGAGYNVDWRNMNAGECLMFSSGVEEGACVIEGASCEFLTRERCSNLNGDFSAGTLCTSLLVPEENRCEKTTQTGCFPDKSDAVYFVDSCGNPANVYDSSIVNSANYWENIIAPENICGDDDIDGANANSKDCGNCNHYLGSICSSALEDGFDVDMGDFYCKDLSCQFLGETYKNGESWCVYDGAVGNGDDVVGSRHWKYSCDFGEVGLEPECDDARRQVCIQSNTLDEDGDVVFRSASCVANDWKSCIALNEEDDVAEQCELIPSCRLEVIDVADKFNFTVCAPEYPAGFDLQNERYALAADVTCGVATMNCTVVKKARLWGGCRYVANEECLTEEFTQQMNDFCKGLGDCGGSANILGEFSDSYEVENSVDLSSSWINRLRNLANPTSGQFIDAEDYVEYLETSGILGKPEDVDTTSTSALDINPIASGVAGLGILAGSLTTGYISIVGKWSSWNIIEAGYLSDLAAGFANIAIGVAIGGAAGAYIAKSMGLSPGGSNLMATGGAIIGVTTSLILTEFISITSVLGIAGLVVGAVLIVIASFFGGSDCDPIDVQFECKPWQPPIGGDDCEKCNDDTTKPCSEYRCHSLGASCEIVNKGEENEMCQSSVDDGLPPVIDAGMGIISGGEYQNINDDGFEIIGETDECLNAGDILAFSIETDELAQCKVGTVPILFDEMEDFGTNLFLYNHTMAWVIPDLSGGMSRGPDFSEDVILYVKCRDTHGHENPNFYKIGMCVNDGDDGFAPIIEAVSPSNDGFVAFSADSQVVGIATNEVSTCRWDVNDVDYSSMRNNMSCLDRLGSPSSFHGYLCTDTLPLAGTENVYYFRCADQPWLRGTDEEGDRNKMRSSLTYVLRKPEKRISIDWIEPSQNFSIATDMTTIDFQVKTSDGGEWHQCSYSFSGYERMLRMFETGEARIHSQAFNLPPRNYEIYVNCTDELGESAWGKTDFEIIRSNLEVAVSEIIDFKTGDEQNTIELEIETSGGGDKHDCVYSIDGRNAVEFRTQGIVGVRRQNVVVDTGSVKIDVACVDELGNSGRGSISFNVDYDTSGTQIARIWQDGGKLNFITIDNVECRYSRDECDFNWEDEESAGTGKEHSLPIQNGNIYYIKCENRFGKVPESCSVVVRTL